MGKSVGKRITFVCFYVNKRQTPFAQWATSKWIKENHLDFCFPYKCINIHVYIYIYIYIHYSSISANKYLQIYEKWNYINVYMYILSVGKRITFVCFFDNKRTNDKLRLHNEQTVNGLRKITWTSVFRINVYIYMYIYIFTYIYTSISAGKYLQIYGKWNYINVCMYIYRKWN